jgi:hypothetical protein
MKMEARIGKVTPKPGFGLVHSASNSSTKEILEQAINMVRRVREGDVDGSPITGFAAVVWTAEGGTTTVVRNEGGVPRMLVPTFVCEAIRDYLLTTP